ncbi:MAG: hypothetical protein HWN69_02780 [Desulfobacterales bacterium]|nr:hypothetical protein [Desulfobacterales bacterium]
MSVRFEIFRTEIEQIMPTGYELAMELAHNLAFSKHEGRPSHFAFLVGTDNVWPVLAEFLSADFGKKMELELFRDESNHPRFLADICEANYSIFQIYGAVGFYNVSMANMFNLANIVRLKQPSSEELKRRDWEAIVDLDDLFCYCVEEIEKKTHEKACIISTEGDGRVRVYGTDQDANKGDLQFIWDIGKDEITRPVPPAVADTLRNFLQENDVYRRIMKVIRKISTTVGEGAMIILTKDNTVSDLYLRQMEFFRPEWQRHLDIQDTPKELLRAAFIMDGASFILFSNAQDNTPRIRIEPRMLTYPHQSGGAYGLIQDLTEKFNRPNQDLDDSDKQIIRKLSGKGSKTHGAANLSKLNDYHRKVNVITISADGPIKVWPDELERDGP